MATTTRTPPDKKPRLTLEVEAPIRPIPPHGALPNGVPAVFLAGSIEMGKAVDWQVKVIAECEADQELMSLGE